MAGEYYEHEQATPPTHQQLAMTALTMLLTPPNEGRIAQAQVYALLAIYGVLLDISAAG